MEGDLALLEQRVHRHDDRPEHAAPRRRGRGSAGRWAASGRPGRRARRRWARISPATWRLPPSSAAWLSTRSSSLIAGRSPCSAAVSVSMRARLAIGCDPGLYAARRRVNRRAVDYAVRDEPVAHARLGDEVPGVRGVGLELAAQLGHVDAQVVGLGLVRRAPRPPGAAARWPTSLPSLRTRTSSRCHSVGVSRTGVAVRAGRTCFAARSTVKRGRLDDRAPRRRPRAAQRRAQPREQLVHPERLGDVVVGAGVERDDLVALSVRAESTMIGASRPARAGPRSPRCRPCRAGRGRARRVGRLARRRRRARCAPSAAVSTS